MIYTHAYFENYIGFYNGMGINKLDIDFTLCKHNVILISGINGSGKSTLLKSLSIFPDPSSFFIPNTEGRKQLSLIDNDNIYEIDIRCGKVSKAFIKKNGAELNPNGNITSYKEIIFTEFELDSSFSSLSSLSSEERGMADKTPAERKRFIANIIENLEVYNNMYKTLNKKSLIFKSHVNTLHTKIQNIGDKNYLTSSLEGLKNKERNLSEQILSLNNSIVEMETKSKIDPEEAERIKEIYNKINSLNIELENVEKEVNIRRNKTHIDFKDIKNQFKSDSDALTEYEKICSSLQVKLNELSNSMNSNSNTLISLKAQLESMTNGIDKEIENKYLEEKDNINNLRNELSFYKLNENISLSSLNSIISILKSICTKIDSLYEDLELSDIEYIIKSFSNDDILKLNNNSLQLQTDLNEEKKKLDELNYKLKSLSVLESKPSNCNINSCPFISEAITIKESLGNKKIDNLISETMNKINTISIDLTNNINDISIWNLRLSKRMIYESIIDSINENKSLFLDLFDYDFLNKLNEILLCLGSYNFILEELNRLSSAYSVLQELDSSSRMYEKLSLEYSTYKDKVSSSSKLSELIESISSEQTKIIDQYNKTKSDINKYDDLKNSFTTKVFLENEYNDYYDKYLSLNEKKMILEDQIKEFNKKSEKTITFIDEINRMKTTINSLTNEQQPISNSISQINGQLTLLDSYYKEYDLYKQKYDTIEILKKYCSPTSGGIQTIFMQIYMSKTLDLANQLLSFLFNGEYRLLDFIINQSEFRIPFIGNGLPVDDISSGSNSQKCMFGTIINLVLMYQSSGKSIPIKMDEVDGPLDHYSRIEFVDTLYKVIPLLNIGQLFLVSHSLEIDVSNVDIIKLKTRDDYDNSSINGNIIYDYSKQNNNVF